MEELCFCLFYEIVVYYRSLEISYGKSDCDLVFLQNIDFYSPICQQRPESQNSITFLQNTKKEKHIHKI